MSCLGDHNNLVSRHVTERIITKLMSSLEERGVSLAGLLLKVAMVLPGNTCHEVAQSTVETLHKSVPPGIGGVVFLSGGQSDDDSMKNLNAISRYNANLGRQMRLSFSYGRALQQSSLKKWKGSNANVEQAQEELVKRCKQASMASLGLLG